MPHVARRKTSLTSWTLAGMLIVVVAGGAIGWARSHCIPGLGVCTRVLFLGNSYTAVNDLPGVLTQLAAAGGHRMETGMLADGGATLAEHARAPETAARLGAARWDFVVLQEQSQIPSVEQSRTGMFYPAAQTLVKQIEGLGATPLLYLTWAHRAGWPENGLADYESMQAQLDYGYLTAARTLDIPVAPAGFAWLMAHHQDPALVLWQADGSHPTVAGTYLAACVFYAAIFRESPVGLSYEAGLPEGTAEELQAVAAKTVLDDLKRWNLR